MKLRLIEQRKERLLLCPNGSILKVNPDVLSQLLCGFKKAKAFKGNDGYWNTVTPSMEDVYGETLAFVDDSDKLVIISEKLFAPEKKVKYISATEYAEMHGKSRASIKVMCSNGRIDGAYKTSSGWLIPEDAPYPERKERVIKKE